MALLFWQQVLALLHKNLLILWRSPIQLFLTLFAPLGVLLGSVYATSALSATFAAMAWRPPDLSSPPIHQVGYSSCSGGVLSICSDRPRVYYAPNDAYHTKVMETFATDNNVRMGIDVVPLSSLDALAKLVIEKQPALQKEWPTTYAVAFTTWGSVEARFNQSIGKEPQFLDTPSTVEAAKAKFTAFSTASPGIPAGTHYTISSFPTAISMSGPSSSSFLTNIAQDGASLVFKHALDRAIIRTRANMEGRAPPSMNVTMSHFAIPAAATASAGMIYSNGGSSDSQAGANRLASSFVSSFLLFGFCPMTLTLALMLSNEKHKGMLGNLRKLGMSEVAYWTATLSTVMAVGGASCAIALLAIPAFTPGFIMYNWHPTVIFGVMFLLAFHLVSLALVIVALFTGPYSTNIFLGLYCFIGILGTSLMGSMDASGLNVYLLLFSDLALGYGLAALPMFPFGKVHSELTQAALRSPNSTITWADPAMTIMRNTTVNSYDYATGKVKVTNIIGPTTRDSLLFMLLIGSASYLVCLYANQVFGGAQPLWYPFSPSYWGFEKKNAIHDRAREDKSLIVDSLQKTFTTSKFCGCSRRKVHAVKNVSFEVRQGRVLSLLGTNGAGKSTCINMISGLILPSRGMVSCFGTANLGKIQTMIGVTSQSDITWPELTAGDHVRLYARLRGVQVKVSSMRDFVLDQLKRVGLEDNVDQQVGKFSGGMRRRLCVLLCAIGEPPLCILDEPTSSLDPINRRKVWQFIQSLKSHSAVILTTHLLQEADYLGDTVCIIDGGEVRAEGTSLALKRQYAPGYEVTLLSNVGVSQDQLQPVIEVYAPKATIIQRSTEMFALTIPRDQGMSNLLRFLQSSDPTRMKLIREFEVSNSSLEQVFLTVSEQAKTERKAATATEGSGGDSSSDSFEMPTFPARQSFFKHVMAVFLKDWTFQFKQFKTTVAIFLLSCLLLGIMVYLLGYMQLETLCPAGHQAVDASTGGRAFSSSSRTCDLSFIQERVRRSWGICAPGSPLGCLIGDYVLPTNMVSQQASQTGNPWSRSGPTTPLAKSARFLVHDPTQARDSFFMSTLTRRNLSAEAKNIPGVYSTWSLSPSSSAASMFSDWPAWPIQVYSTSERPETSILETIKTLTNKPQTPPPSACAALTQWGTNNAFVYNSTAFTQELSTRLPDYGVSIVRFSPAASEMHIVTAPGGSYQGYSASDTALVFYSLSPDQRNCTMVRYRQLRAPGEALRFNISNLVTQRLGDSPGSSYWSENDYGGDGSHIELLHSISNAQLRLTLGPNTNEAIYGSINTLPSISGPELLAVLPLYLVPSAIYVLFVAYLQVPFYEKELNLIDFYRINGLSTSATWVGHYLFSFTLSVPVVTAAVTITTLYVPTIAIGSFIFISLVAVHGAICMAFVLAGIIQSTTMARLISFLFPAVAGALASTLVLFSDAPLPGVAGLFPPLAFARNMYQLTYGGGIDATLIAVAIVAGFIYLGFAVLLFNFTDISPLVLVSNWFYRVTAKHMKQRKSEIKVAHGTTTDALVEAGATATIKNMSMNRDGSTTTPDGALTTESGVHVVNVTKSFGPTQVLKGVSMSVTKGTTFGLLGPNGGGKTTLINILTGVSRPNSGQAWVAGSPSTSRGLSKVISVCPQSDLVLGDLTVEENLRFFARMRGAPLFGSVLNNVVKHTTKNVGLGDVPERAASALSGGMRRRLAMGIAVVGGPQVILCDEPSAGLDAGNRIGIWRLLGKIREAEEPPTIIITTHFMSEAEALCSRLGILAGGKMRVMGNQVALRAQYGQGYMLNMQVPVSVEGRPNDKPISLDEAAQGAEAAGMNAIVQELTGHLNLDLCAEHELLSGQAGQRACGGQFNKETSKWEWEIRVQVKLPAVCDLAAVFELMSYSPCRIQDWGISHSSLEDVFIRVATQQYS